MKTSDHPRGAREWTAMGHAFDEMEETETARAAFRRAEGELAGDRRGAFDAGDAARLAGDLATLDRAGARRLLERCLGGVAVETSEVGRDVAVREIGRAVPRLLPHSADWAVGRAADALQTARARGRREVLSHVAAFAPLALRLGIIRPVWDRIRGVEGLLERR
jgi:hypothetical protein